MPLPRRLLDEELAKEILSYFLRNPRAADTLAGVVRWRLPEERVHRAAESVNGALEWLVEEGYLDASDTESAGRVFSLHAEKRRDAERFVGDAGDATPTTKRPKRRS
jgi:hypothetical protein